MTLDRTDLPIDGPLFSVAGNSERFVTVGGFGEGVIDENEGSGWVFSSATAKQPLTGVAISGGPGVRGRPARNDPRSQQELGAGVGGNLAGLARRVHPDPDGGVWATGGMFNKTPTTDGVLVYKGPPLSGAFQ